MLCLCEHQGGRMSYFSVEQGFWKGRILGQLVSLSAGRLFGQSSLKIRLILIAQSIQAHLGVVRIHDLYGVTQHDDDLHRRREVRDFSGRLCGVEIPNRGLSDGLSRGRIKVLQILLLCWS